MTQSAHRSSYNYAHTAGDILDVMLFGPLDAVMSDPLHRLDDVWPPLERTRTTDGRPAVWWPATLSLPVGTVPQELFEFSISHYCESNRTTCISYPILVFSCLLLCTCLSGHSNLLWSHSPLTCNAWGNLPLSSNSYLGSGYSASKTA